MPAPRAAVEPIRREDFFPASWDEAVSADLRTGRRAPYGIPGSVENRCLLYNRDLPVPAWVRGRERAAEALAPGVFDLLHRQVPPPSA